MASPQEFYTAFQASRADIAVRLDTIGQTDSERIARIAQDINIERKRLNDATPFLPAYDRRSYESQLQELETRIDALKSKNDPAKGKFAFKMKAPGPASSTAAPISKPDLLPTPSNLPEQQSQLKSTPNLQLSSTSYQCFTATSLSQKTASTSDLTISDLVHCIVDLLPQDASAEADYLKLTAVHIRDVKDSVLLLGHVHGSILVHNIERCVVVVACHQLRVHSSHNNRFHLHVSSHAVIEDCAALAFAPYPDSLPLPPDVRQQKSTHHAVQDFSHLKNTPSPHWSALPDSVPVTVNSIGSEASADLPEENASVWWSAIRSSAHAALATSRQEREVLLTPVFAKALPQIQ